MEAIDDVDLLFGNREAWEGELRRLRSELEEGKQRSAALSARLDRLEELLGVVLGGGHDLPDLGSDVALELEVKDCGGAPNPTAESGCPNPEVSPPVVAEACPGGGIELAGENRGDASGPTEESGGPGAGFPAVQGMRPVRLLGVGRGQNVDIGLGVDGENGGGVTIPERGTNDLGVDARAASGILAIGDSICRASPLARSGEVHSRCERGLSFRSLAPRLEKFLAGHPWRQIILWVGGNDVYPHPASGGRGRATPFRVPPEAAAVIRRCAAVAIEVVVLTPTPRPRFDEGVAWVATPAYKMEVGLGALRALAPNVRVLKVGRALTTHLRRGDRRVNCTWFAIDGIHVNPRGMCYLWEGVGPRL